MGSEQSQPQHPHSLSGNGSRPSSLREQSRISNRFQRGATISEPDTHYATGVVEEPLQPEEFRAVSPPISVCSDSDLPYISYTDRPIGDSPKIRNKQQTASYRNVRSNSISSTSSRKTALGAKPKQRPVSATHNIVVVRSAKKDAPLDRDPDMVKLKNIPQFLPVMRSTLSIPSNRDPEILERLQPIHLHNICARIQQHLNICATQTAANQQEIFAKIKETDQKIAKLFASYVAKQKEFSIMAEEFSKLRSVSSQLSRCNTLLNQNIESMETLNNFLDVENRLEPFVWKTD